MIEQKLIKIPVRDILIDVDEVIVGLKKNSVDPVGKCCMNVLVSMVLQKCNIDLPAAKKKIRKHYNPSTETIDVVLTKLGINKKEYWNRIVVCLKKYLHVYPDAVAMVKRLYRLGFPLYPATTNSAFLITAKFATGNLATYMHVPYYKAILGGSEVYPKGKSCPEFYKALMKKFSLKAKETLMIGDNPLADLLYARQSGIKNVVLVRRTQKDDCIIENDGCIYVRSLRIVPDMLLKIKDRRFPIRSQVKSE